MTDRSTDNPARDPDPPMEAGSAERFGDARAVRLPPEVLDAPQGVAMVVGGGADPAGGPAGGGAAALRPPLKRRRRFMDHIEAFISRLTSRSTFWHRVASLVWLPYAFKSGIKIKRVDNQSFSAVLPFRRFNRNWYNAMAGASLLANSEIAGGMYIYGECGGDWTVVCKHLSYRFLRPCFGPAVYRCTPRRDLKALLAAGHEFNFDLDIDVVQQLPARGREREVRVGRCLATFHITPKALHEARKARRAGGVGGAGSGGGAGGAGGVQSPGGHGGGEAG